MSLKITLIGAGSVVFAKNLIGDILQSPELCDATICLMDIDPQRLKVAKIMTEKMISKLQVPAKVQATLSQREAVRDANYVICTVQVGGYKPCTVIDFEIPKKYGVQQTIADTLGVGGVFRALRTIPVINKIAQDIADVGAKNCLFLNYTNPMAMNCRGIHRSTGVPHVGLCHSVQGTSRMLANFARLPYEDVNYLVAGINHMAFFLKFEYKGQDAYPLLFKLLEDPNFKNEKVRMEMMRRTGYFVTESSEHQSEYVPYFIHHGKKIIDQFDIPIDEYIRRCESIISTWESAEKELLGHDGDIQVGPRSHEYGAFIIHSRETNTPRVIYGNVPNEGHITNLPQGACVEVPCLIDRNGIQPTFIGDLPPQLASICRTNINVQEVTVEAALTQKREHIYHAVMLDPHTATVLPLDKIWAMCDELIEAHQKVGFLGEFKPVIKNTGRAYAGTADRVVARTNISSHTDKKIALEVTVSNPLSKAINVPFRLVASVNGHKTGKALVSGKIQIPAGKTIKKGFDVSSQLAPNTRFTVCLETSLKDVLTIDADSFPRQVIKTNEEGKGTFKVELNGFPATKGTVGLNGKFVELDLKVDDTNVKPNEKCPWQGSGVELFFANVFDPRLTQIFFVPKTQGKKGLMLDKCLKPISGATAEQSITPSGYTVRIRIPVEATGIKGKSFLFDSFVNLNALGDAHSGGRAAMNGNFESNISSTHYSLVE